MATRTKKINLSRIDPTRTTTLRRALVTKLRKAFARLKGMIVRQLVHDDAFGLSTQGVRVLNRLTTNAPGEWSAVPDAAKVKAFVNWLRQQMRSKDLKDLGDDELLREYARRGLLQGAQRSYDDVVAKKAENPDLAQSLDEQLGFAKGTREEFLRSAFNQPVATEKVELLASRSFADLEGITRDMEVKLQRGLADGLVAGKSPREIARDLVKQLDISRARAETMARTEIVRAHAEGQLIALEQLGVEEVGVMVEWLTAGDEHVCDACAPLEGVVLTLDEARGMLPRHPNCRCAWIPANVGEDKEDQKRSAGEVRGAIKESKEQGAMSDEDEGFAWGPGTRISTQRPEGILNMSSDLLALSRLIPVENMFCPTGPGGGVDPTCSPDAGGAFGGGGGASSVDQVGQLEKAAPPASDPSGARGQYLKSPIKSTEESRSPQMREKALDVMFAGKATEETVSIDSLTGMQGEVSQKSLEHMVQEKGKPGKDYIEEKPTVVEVDGKLYLYDGHHRTVSEMMSGKTEIKAKVYRAPPPKKTSTKAPKGKAKPPTKAPKAKPPTKPKNKK